VSRPPALIDSHAHLDAPALAPLSETLDRAAAAGVTAIIAVGTTAEDSRRVVGIARRWAGVSAAVGIHPNEAAAAGPDDWGRLLGLVEEPEVVAIGETGLDRYRDHTPFPTQQDFFDRHLALARDLALPVVIHCRDSQADIIAQLERQVGPTRGVLHSFTGTWDHAQAFLALGLHVSFAGMITFTNKNLDALRDVATRVPLDRLLVETDSPYLSPHPFRGKPNEPARVALTAARLAELRGITLDELARATTENARKLFGLDGNGRGDHHKGTKDTKEIQ
jgi:TatD DNase family protein